MTCFTGTARVLASLKDQWKGTPVFIGQPAEEVGMGARAMLNDGLFKRFPRPDYTLALRGVARESSNRLEICPGREGTCATRRPVTASRL